MKKVLLTLSLVALAGAAFAQDIDFSAGGSVGYTFAGVHYDTKYGATNYVTDGSTNYLSVNGFFDATFAQVAVGVSTQLGKTSFKSGSTTSELESNAINLDLQALGKYPFAFDKLVVFPAAGLTYSLNLAAKDKNTKSDTEKSELNDLYVNLGAGIDYALTENLYVRGLVLGGYNLTTDIKSTKDQDPDYKHSGFSVAASVGVGYKF